MKTFKQFITESRFRALTLGPSRSPVGRQRQQEYQSQRAAFRRAGLRRSRPNQPSERKRENVRFNAFPNEFTSTTITSYPNQSSFARDVLKPKVDDKSKRVVPTAQRALFLKRLKNQVGNRVNRPIHTVDVLPKKDFKKNDPNQLITRGKKFHQAVRSIPSNVKEIGGKPGDKILGKASEVMPGSKDPTVGKKKREALYSRVLDATKKDPITKYQSFTLK